MPLLPWKKGGRISKLVADHLHSPKHGGSLVLETGFPTSLIDLFVKNRNRLINKKKQRYAQHQHQQHHDDDDLMLLSTTTTTPTPPHVSWNSNGIADEISSKSGFMDSNKAVGGEDEDEDEDEGEDGVEQVENANHRVLLSVMKLSLVVILAFSTKKITVGITLSALLLILLDYVGKHVYKSLGSLIQLVLGFLSIKQEKLVTQVKFGDSKSPLRQHDSLVWSSSTKGPELNIPNQDIQILQPNSNFSPPFEGIQSVKLDEFQTPGVIELKARRSRSAKIKSNIKKLVPQKLRSSKKKKKKMKDLENEETSSSGQGKVVKCEEQKQDGDWESLSLFSSGMYAELGVDEDDEEQVLACSEPEVVENVVPTVRESNSETKRNSGYLIFFLIVLVGLVGGRVFALLLTLLWCLMIKSAGKLRRYVKVPRSLVSCQKSVVKVTGCSWF